MDDHEAQAEIAATTIKLPPFWPADPELWFKQVEAQFDTKKITADLTKYNHLVASLTPETAQEVREFLFAPPEADRFKTLKDAIIKRTTSSAQARVKELLNDVDLDGRKPTQLLRRMRQLIGSNTSLIGDDLLKQLFVSRLPKHAQAVLASQDSLSLDKMAELADKVVEAVGPQVFSMEAGNELVELRRELNEIKELLRGRNREPGSSSNRSRSKTPAARAGTADPTVCFFHRKSSATRHASVAIPAPTSRETRAALARRS